MQTKRELYGLEIGMLVINFFMICLLCCIMIMATGKICLQDQAREFLGISRHVGIPPWHTFFYCILLFLVFAIEILLKKRERFSRYISTFCFSVVGIFCCIELILFLHMSYNGILLLFIAEMITYMPKKGEKIVFFLFSMVIYICSDYELLSIYFKLPCFYDYLSIYSQATHMYLLGIKNILASINNMLFIGYIIFLMQSEMEKHKKEKKLNEELSITNQKLQEANLQLKECAATAEKVAQTRERNRLAREIHDTLGHTLTGISAGIDACIATIEVSTQATKKQLLVISGLARQGIQDVRRSVSKLRPDSLQRLPLAEALDKMVSNMQQASHVEIILNRIEKLAFNEDEEEAIYRVVQEGLTNAVRHGKATKIYVSITKRANVLTLQIQDNGIGCKKVQDGFGLRHMKERIHLLKGKISYNGDNGFKIIAEIPIRWGEEYD